MNEWRFTPEAIEAAREIAIGDRVTVHWKEAECQEQEATVVGVQIERYGRPSFAVIIDGDLSPTDGFYHDRSSNDAGSISLLSRHLSAVPDGEGELVERVKELETELDRITNLHRLAVQRDGMTLATLERERETARLSQAGVRVSHKFKLGDRVTKTKGSSWTGHVVGFYSTGLTPVGYAVESENEPGSVQIYPEAALSGDTP